MPPDYENELEWRKYITTRVDGLYELMAKVRIEIAKLKVKAGIWGLIGGAIPVIVMIFLWWMSNGN